MAKKDEAQSEQEKADAIKAESIQRRLSVIAGLLKRYDKEMELANAGNNVYLTRAIQSKVDALKKEQVKLDPSLADKPKGKAKEE